MGFNRKGGEHQFTWACDWQPAGGFPDVCVMALEERFQWFMNTYLRSSKEGPLGKVVDCVWNKEYQKRGAVHWHMLLWISVLWSGVSCVEVGMGQLTGWGWLCMEMGWVTKASSHGGAGHQGWWAGHGHSAQKSLFCWYQHKWNSLELLRHFDFSFEQQLLVDRPSTQWYPQYRIWGQHFQSHHQTHSPKYFLQHKTAIVELATCVSFHIKSQNDGHKITVSLC